MIVIGHTKETYKDNKYPSIFNLISDAPIENKSAILSHLKKGVVTSEAPARLTDVISGERIDRPLQMMNDGTFAWRSDVIYYFEKYNLKLDDTFLNHVLRNK